MADHRKTFRPRHLVFGASFARLSASASSGSRRGCGAQERRRCAGGWQIRQRRAAAVFHDQLRQRLARRGRQGALSPRHRLSQARPAGARHRRSRRRDLARPARPGPRQGAGQSRARLSGRRPLEPKAMPRSRGPQSRRQRRGRAVDRRRWRRAAGRRVDRRLLDLGLTGSQSYGANAEASPTPATHAANASGQWTHGGEFRARGKIRTVAAA